MDTYARQSVNQKPRRRHSEQFKAQVLAACGEPGAETSAVVVGVNANLCASGAAAAASRRIKLGHQAR